ncbi:MAG: hypothetical protein LIO94_03375 [Clostridiales bacterium]|nr:hypothetical protein [Clostridiales bacterium]
MTRGKIQFIDRDWKVYSTIEFNGDMYPSGHGHEIITHFRNGGFGNKDDFEKYVLDFDERNFGYNDSGYGLTTLLGTYVGSPDFVFNEYYTDYLYIVNESEKEIILSSKEDRESPETEIMLPAGKLAVVRFYAVKEIVSREHIVSKELPRAEDIRNLLDALHLFSDGLDKLQKVITDYSEHLNR